MSVFDLAARLVMTLAIIPGAYRPPNDEAESWAGQLRALLTWIHAWSFSVFLAAWYLDRKSSKDPDVRKILKGTPAPGSPGAPWQTSKQADLFWRACQAAEISKTEWEAATAAVAMASAVNAMGLLGMMQAMDIIDKGSLANIVIFPTTDNPLQARYEAILHGRDLQSVPMKTSRLDRFNRADFEARDNALSLVSTPPGTTQPDESVAKDHLRALGHSEAEIARLMAGPPAKKPESEKNGTASKPDEREAALKHLQRLGYSEQDAQRLLDGPTKA